MKRSWIYSLAILAGGFLTGCSDSLEDGGLRIGWAQEDITPRLPVSLRGQYYERVANEIHSPLTVTACAIESPDENGRKEQAIMASLDVVNIPVSLQDSIRIKVQAEIPGFDVQKLFLNATHSHSAPDPDPSGEFGRLVIEKAGRAIVAAWNNRKPAGISRGLGYAVTGHNRRVRYADGTAQMYGLASRDDFVGLEGSTDPGVDMLFCWDLNKALTGIIMNVSCPAQVVEAKYIVSSDYWGEVRKRLGEKYPGDIYVLAQCGAAGDISPRDLPQGYRAGEPNMWDVPGLVEIGRRLARTVDDTYPDARNAIQVQPPFKHTVMEIDLPARQVSEEEYLEALAAVKDIKSREPADPDSPESAWNRFLREVRENEKTRDYGPWDNKLTDLGQLKKKEALVSKYEQQEQDAAYPVEVHILRLGDVVMATNPFELYVEYGLRITGRSRAKQTFIVQLGSGWEGYLPTRKAIAGGGYSAMVTRVGPAGGQILVDETVKGINMLFGPAEQE
jgi:hypothetical protein